MPAPVPNALAVKVRLPSTVVTLDPLASAMFRAVVIECGAMMMKRLAEVIVGRIKKKEKIDITESEDTNNDY